MLRYGSLPPAANGPIHIVMPKTLFEVGPAGGILPARCRWGGPYRNIVVLFVWPKSPTVPLK